MSCSMMSRRRVRFWALSRNSIAAQRMRLKRMRLIRWMMIGTLASAAAPHLGQVFLDDLDVAVAQGARITGDDVRAFQVLEARRAGERECQFVVVHDVEDEDVVMAVPQHLHAAKEWLAIDKDVGD